MTGDVKFLLVICLHMFYKKSSTFQDMTRIPDSLEVVCGSVSITMGHINPQ